MEKLSHDFDSGWYLGKRQQKASVLRVSLSVSLDDEAQAGPDDDDDDGDDGDGDDGDVRKVGTSWNALSQLLNTRHYPETRVDEDNHGLQPLCKFPLLMLCVFPER